jgi:hypothetical protein
MKGFLKQNWFKILAIVILIGAMWSHPYSYYQILRWVTAITGAYLGYISFSNKNVSWGWVFVAIAILFNPILPFYFDKGTWQILDLITAGIFLISLKK